MTLKEVESAENGGTEHLGRSEAAVLCEHGAVFVSEQEAVLPLVLLLIRALILALTRSPAHVQVVILRV